MAGPRPWCRSVCSAPWYSPVAMCSTLCWEPFPGLTTGSESGWCWRPGSWSDQEQVRRDGTKIFQNSWKYFIQVENITLKALIWHHKLGKLGRQSATSNKTVISKYFLAINAATRYYVAAGTLLSERTTHLALLSLFTTGGFILGPGLMVSTYISKLPPLPHFP